MTRNCLNVMQKYASMEKEAGAWDKLLGRVFARFPNRSLQGSLDLANKLYGRKLTRALGNRVVNSANRANAIVRSPGASQLQRMTAAQRLRDLNADAMSPSSFAGKVRRNVRSFNKDVNVFDDGLPSSQGVVPTNPTAFSFTSSPRFMTGITRDVVGNKVTQSY